MQVMYTSVTSVTTGGKTEVLEVKYLGHKYPSFKLQNLFQKILSSVCEIDT
jgi:hypothetical protein